MKKVSFIKIDLSIKLSVILLLVSLGYKLI